MLIRESDSAEARAYLEAREAAAGYVMNLERVWAWRPDVADAFRLARTQLTDRSTLSAREAALLVCVVARSLGDSYCALAWGGKLAKLAGPATAAALLRGEETSGLDAREAALALWAASIARSPNGTTAAQIDALRTAGFSEREIFEATAFVALRLAFSLVNDALGARPDAEIFESAPAEVQRAVTYGRPPLRGTSSREGS
jgi:uncharacterized peroxidase-related enzyme